MEISNSPIEFTSDDAQLWRAFLRTQAGERLIPKLLEAIPPLLGGGETNNVLIRSGEVRGFQSAAQTLLSLAFPQADIPRTVMEYPDLMDDKAFNDGQTLEPQK